MEHFPRGFPWKPFLLCFSLFVHLADCRGLPHQVYGLTSPRWMLKLDVLGRIVLGVGFGFLEPGRLARGSAGVVKRKVESDKLESRVSGVISDA